MWSIKSKITSPVAHGLPKLGTQHRCGIIIPPATTSKPLIKLCCSVVFISNNRSFSLEKCKGVVIDGVQEHDFQLPPTKPYPTMLLALQIAVFHLNPDQYYFPAPSRVAAQWWQSLPLHSYGMELIF